MPKLFLCHDLSSEEDNKKEQEIKVEPESKSKRLPPIYLTAFWLIIFFLFLL